MSDEREEIIKRGWELQKAEAQTDEERDFCDWMIARGWRMDDEERSPVNQN